MNEKRTTRGLSAIRRNRLGQASAEYLIMLAMVAMLIVGVKRILQPAFDRISDSFGERVDTLLDEGNMHRLPLK